MLSPMSMRLCWYYVCMAISLVSLYCTLTLVIFFYLVYVSTLSYCLLSSRVLFSNYFPYSIFYDLFIYSFCSYCCFYLYYYLSYSYSLLHYCSYSFLFYSSYLYSYLLFFVFSLLLPLFLPLVSFSIFTFLLLPYPFMTLLFFRSYSLSPYSLPYSLSYSLFSLLSCILLSPNFYFPCPYSDFSYCSYAYCYCLCYYAYCC